MAWRVIGNRFRFCKFTMKKDYLGILLDNVRDGILDDPIEWFISYNFEFSKLIWNWQPVYVAVDISDYNLTATANHVCGSKISARLRSDDGSCWFSDTARFYFILISCPRGFAKGLTLINDANKGLELWHDTRPQLLNTV